MSESRINSLRDDIQEVKEVEGKRHCYTTNVVAKLLGICEKLIDELDRQEQRADDQAQKLIALQARAEAHKIRLEELGKLAAADELNARIGSPRGEDEPVLKSDIISAEVVMEIVEKRRGKRKLRKSRGR